jgi:hypothetical protein
MVLAKPIKSGPMITNQETATSIPFLFMGRCPVSQSGFCAFVRPLWSEAGRGVQPAGKGI